MGHGLYAETQESLWQESIRVTKKFHVSQGDVWGWRWQKLRQYPVFQPK